MRVGCDCKYLQILCLLHQQECFISKIYRLDVTCTYTKTGVLIRPCIYIYIYIYTGCW